MESIFSNTTEEKLALNELSFLHLEETAKWGKFLAIVQFVGLALMVIVALVMGIFLPEMNNAMTQESPVPISFSATFIMILYLGMAVLMFFPALYLYHYAVKLKMAIQEKNSEVLGDAFNHQRRLYKFIGIVTIVVIAIYAIVFIGAMIGGLIAVF